jgi:hypothetical protein
MDDVTREKIAESLDELAAQNTWNANVWQRCYDVVSLHMNDDDLLGYIFDDLIHYSGRRLFTPAPIPADFNEYRQEFRDIAAALRSGLSLSEGKRKYDL